MLHINDIPRRICQLYGLKPNESTPEETKRLLEELFMVVSESEGGGKSSYSLNTGPNDIGTKIFSLLMA